MQTEPSNARPATGRAFRVVGVVVAVGLIAIFLSALGDPSPEEPAAEEPKPSPSASGMFPHAAQDVVDLLDGLRPGDTLAGCTVLTIASPKEGQVFVDLQKGDGYFGVGVVARKPDRKYLPPVETERYDVIIGHVRGASPPSLDVTRPAADALAERVRRREMQVPRPAGM